MRYSAMEQRGRGKQGTRGRRRVPVEEGVRMLELRKYSRGPTSASAVPPPETALWEEVFEERVAICEGLVVPPDPPRRR